MTIQDKDLLLVGVPEHHKCLTINLSDDGKKIYLFVESPGTRYEISYDIPEGNWEPVGLYPGLTEEQAAKVSIHSTHYFGFYQNAANPNSHHKSDQIKSALESFASRMEALGAYIKNPMGEKPEYPVLQDSQPVNIPRTENEHTMQIRDFQDRLKIWNNYQSRTSGQWLVLMKK